MFQQHWSLTVADTWPFWGWNGLWRAQLQPLLFTSSVQGNTGSNGPQFPGSCSRGWTCNPCPLPQHLQSPPFPRLIKQALLMSDTFSLLHLIRGTRCETWYYSYHHLLSFHRSHWKSLECNIGSGLVREDQGCTWSCWPISSLGGRGQCSPPSKGTARSLWTRVGKNTEAPLRLPAMKEGTLVL